MLFRSKKVTTRLNGNLYIKGLGDPSFSEENILNMVSSLIEKNIQTVSGNLYYDDFNFQTKNSFKTIQNARYYYAPESALSCNYNKLSLMIDNASTPSITLKKETGYAKIKHNDLVVLDTKKAYWPKISYQQKKWGDDYRIQGAVSLADQKNDYLDVLVSQPGLYSATLFKEACEKRGITFLGKIQRRATPKHSKLLHVEKGKLLSDILLELNQNSNNVIARQLNHHLAKKRRQSVSSYELGTKAVRSFCIKKIKLKKGSFLIDDISGLSKNNKISPDAFSNALHYFYKKKHRYQALFSSLIQVGKHPLYRKEPPQNLDVFFKTGTLPKTGVNALVGYIKDKQSETLYTIVILAERQDKRPAYSGSLTFPVLHKTMALLNRNL